MSQLRVSAPSLSSSSTASTRSASHETQSKPHKARRDCTNRKKGRPPPQPFPFLSNAARVLAIPELAELILGHLSQSRLHNLAAVGQVCKLWWSIIQPYLFHEISIHIGAYSRTGSGHLMSSRETNPYGYKDVQLYNLLCRNASMCTLIREFTITGFGQFDFACLLSGCNALTTLHMSLAGPQDNGIDLDAGLSLLETVGATLQELQLSYWWDFGAQAWVDLLEPLQRLKSFTLEDIFCFKDMQSGPLKLHDTLKTLIVQAEDQFDFVSGNGLSKFLGAFNNLEYLDFSIDLLEMQLPVEALPSSLHSFELADPDPTGYLEILLRLASPEWLPNLRKPPILNVTGIMEDVIRERRDEMGDGAWPTHADVQRLMKEAETGLKKRKGWEGGDDKAPFWPDLLELFVLPPEDVVAAQEGNPAP